uniref:CHAT domain-containing protein n=1 Tax=Candidatus Kentrum sp. LPFa TaxID=2126335 RepID=A0A450Y2Z5_9GAMM|nr:MAG: CHAT domain-containing protein [Candidatus Kentron sp. LPFa]VFK35906.1 MAG: CHAT domain-containing protein [Candidatus Kentron sp. LPFa]
MVGEEHPLTLATQLNLAITHINNRKISLALRELRKMDPRLQGFVGVQFDSTLSEKVRRQWSQSQSIGHVPICGIHSLALAEFVPEENKAEAVGLAADILLRWQRLAGEREALIAHLARVSEDPKIRELAESLAEARTAWSRLVNMPKPNPKAVAITRDKVEEMEVQLAGLSREFKEQQSNRTLEWRKVEAALPNGSVLLSLRALEPIDFKTGSPGERRWLALLIPAAARDETEIILKDLGPANTVAEQFKRFRDTDSSEDARELYTLLFGELGGELAKYNTLYLAPDGLLDLLPFAELLLPDFRYWIQHKRLHQIRAGRDLLRELATGEETATTFVAFGDQGNRIISH